MGPKGPSAELHTEHDVPQNVASGSRVQSQPSAAETADSSRPLEDDHGGNVPLQPPPLPTGEAPFQMFGELHSALPGIPPLAVKQMYHAATDGTIDFRTELRRLNRELLFAFVGMLAAVVGEPSQSARSVEVVGALAHNLQHLLNRLRPHQAAATMEHALRVELQEQTAAVLSMRTRRTCCHGMLTSAAEQLATLGSSQERLMLEN